MVAPKAIAKVDDTLLVGCKHKALRDHKVGIREAAYEVELRRGVAVLCGSAAVGVGVDHLMTLEVVAMQKECGCRDVEQHHNHKHNAAKDIFSCNAHSLKHFSGGKDNQKNLKTSASEAKYPFFGV